MIDIKDVLGNSLKNLYFSNELLLSLKGENNCLQDFDKNITILEPSLEEILKDKLPILKYKKLEDIKGRYDANIELISDWDYLQKNKNYRLELKTDIKSFKTGNVAIEYKRIYLNTNSENKEEDTGIMLNSCDVWIHLCGKGNVPYLFLCNKDAIINSIAYINASTGFIYNEEGNSIYKSLFKLIPIEKFKEINNMRELLHGRK